MSAQQHEQIESPVVDLCGLRATKCPHKMLMGAERTVKQWVRKMQSEQFARAQQFAAANFSLQFACYHMLGHQCVRGAKTLP